MLSAFALALYATLFGCGLVVVWLFAPWKRGERP